MIVMGASPLDSLLLAILTAPLLRRVVVHEDKIQAKLRAMLAGNHICLAVFFFALAFTTTATNITAIHAFCSLFLLGSLDWCDLRRVRTLPTA